MTLPKSRTREWGAWVTPLSVSPGSLFNGYKQTSLPLDNVAKFYGKLG